MRRGKVLKHTIEELRGYKNNFWKYDFEHYKLWCFRLDKKESDYKNLLEYKRFLQEL